MSRAVLVTGATGFIGQHVVAALRDAGYETWATVKRRRGAAEPESAKAMHWDLLDPRGPDESLPVVEAVIHMAARMPGPRGGEADDFNENLAMTANLLAHLRELQHVVFVSSVDVYGRPRDLPVREDHLTEPLTAYGHSKLSCEQYLQTAGAARGFTMTILRVAQVYGPGEPAIKAIPRFLEAIRAGRPPVIYGDGSDLRDYVYVDDAVRAIILALQRRPRNVFNISSGQAYAIVDVVKLLAEVVPGGVRPVFADRLGERLDLWFDISRAKEVLGYSPQVALREGLRRQYEWAVREAS